MCSFLLIALWYAFKFCTKQHSCKNKSYSQWGENTESEQNRFTRVFPSTCCVPRGCPGCSFKSWRLTVMLWEQPSVPGSAAAQAAPSTRKSFPSPRLITPNRPSGLRWCVTFLGNLSWLPVSSSLLFVYVSYIGVATAAVLYYYICIISWSVLSH